MIAHKTFSHFLSTVVDKDGRHKWSSATRHNLTTDAAAGYTNRRDWQAKAMGGGVTAVASMAGTATAATATTLVNAGATFPTTGQGLAGAMVAAGPSATGTGSTVFGVIVSNTATTLTIDQWYSAGTMAIGTTPAAAATYQILPGQFPAMYLALSTSAVAPTTSDTTLAGEITTVDLARAIGVYAHTAAASTYTLQKVFNATTTATINKEAVFGAANTTAGGVMPFESIEPNPPALSAGDTLTQLVTVNCG